MKCWGTPIMTSRCANTALGLCRRAQEKEHGADRRTRRAASGERQTPVAAALRGQLDVVDLLVTADTRDFGRLFGRELRGTRVVTLAMAIDLVLKGAGT